MQHSKPGDTAVVELARTARISELARQNESQDVIRACHMEYFSSMVGGVGPPIAVIKDVDYPNCTAR